MEMMAVAWPQLSVTLLKFPEETFLSRKGHVAGKAQRCGQSAGKAWSSGLVTGGRGCTDRQQLGCGAAGARLLQGAMTRLRRDEC